MSILFSLTQLIWMPLNGFRKAHSLLSDIITVQKRFDRVKKAFKLQFTVSICFSLFAVALVGVFPTAFLKMFTNDQELIDIGINSTRLFPCRYVCDGCTVCVSADVFGIGRGENINVSCVP